MLPTFKAPLDLLAAIAAHTPIPPSIVAEHRRLVDLHRSTTAPFEQVAIRHAKLAASVSNPAVCR